MRAMNETQFKLVKSFLEWRDMTPKLLVKKWNAIWKKQGSDTRLELHEVCRVQLCINFDVYKDDETPEEDVLLAMFGLNGA